MHRPPADAQPALSRCSSTATATAAECLFRCRVNARNALMSIDFSASMRRSTGAGAVDGSVRSNIALPSGGTLSYTSSINGAPARTRVTSSRNRHRNYPRIRASTRSASCKRTVRATSVRIRAWRTTQGYVLAEGQTTSHLAARQQCGATLALEGVMESAFILRLRVGRRHAGLRRRHRHGASRRDVSTVRRRRDENGTAIPNQTVGGTTIGLRQRQLRVRRK